MIQRCRTCCYPRSKPDLHFDETGECSACTSHKKRRQIDWHARMEDLKILLDRYHGEVLVPSSGGKDSTYIALRLKELGAHVTAVTATTCHLTPVGRANIDNLARHVGTIEITPNMTVRAKLNRLGLQLVGDISWPEHASIFSVPFKVANERNGALLMYGENPQEAYGGPLGSDEARQMTKRWVSEFGGFNGLRPMDFVGLEGITLRDMLDYSLPPVLFAGTEAHFLGAYEEWDSLRNADYAVQHGMSVYGNEDGSLPPSVANWWVEENLDNAQTGIHDHIMFRKYGYGRGCAQISVDVRNGVLSREAAMRWVQDHDGRLPAQYCGIDINEVLDRIGMDLGRYLELADRFTNKVLVRSGHTDASAV